MKVSTLTVHLPKNYGNALQMLALQRYIKSLGHTTQLLSHWHLPYRQEILFWHLYWNRSIINKISFSLACLTWTGKFCAFRRESKILKWLNTYIDWSEEEGYGGAFPSHKIDTDAIVVGSDQVWNSGCHFVKFFMLPDFHDKIKKISYAASFNSSAFPSEDYDFYKTNFNKFQAISVREASSVPLLQERFGVKATLVCDPSLFFTKEEWKKILNIKNRKTKPFNMCYIVSPKGQEYFNEIIKIRKLTKKPLHVFAFDCTEIQIRGKSAILEIAKTISKRIRLFFSGVRLHFAADPTDFIQYINDCEGLFTDSFHGLMFATIFEKKCNAIVGQDKNRQQMKAKLIDFANTFGNPAMISKNFDPELLTPLSVSSQLKAFINSSKQWLKQELSK